MAKNTKEAEEVKQAEPLFPTVDEFMALRYKEIEYMVRKRVVGANALTSFNSVVLLEILKELRKLNKGK